MSKRRVYGDEPINIGRRVGLEVLPGRVGTRPVAGRPRSGRRPITLRLPATLLAEVRRGSALSEFIAAKLQGLVCPTPGRQRPSVQKLARRRKSG
jgi:hypothetical protein